MFYRVVLKYKGFLRNPSSVGLVWIRNSNMAITTLADVLAPSDANKVHSLDESIKFTV